MATKTWTAIPNELVERAKYLGPWEQEDPKKPGEYNMQEILHVPDYNGKQYLVFGGQANAILLQSGYMEYEEGETDQHALQELIEELEVYYRDGRQFTNRIVCNDRM